MSRETIRSEIDNWSRSQDFVNRVEYANNTFSLNKLFASLAFKKEFENLKSEIREDSAKSSKQLVRRKMANFRLEIPALVTKEMNTQFPTYLNNHPGMQAAMATQLSNVSTVLSTHAQSVIDSVVKDKKNTIIADRYLDNVNTQCNTQLASVNQEVVRRFAVWDDMYKNKLAKLESEIKDASELKIKVQELEKSNNGLFAYTNVLFIGIVGYLVYDSQRRR